MTLVSWRPLLILLIVLCLLPNSVGSATKTSKKNEPYWDARKGPPPIIQQADAEHKKGNIEGALALLKQALKTMPPEFLHLYQGELYSKLGICHAELKHFDEAIAALNISNSISSKPFPQNYGWLGSIYGGMRDYPMAERNWQKVVELDPNYAQSYVELASASLHLGHYDEAQRAIDSGREKADSAQVLQGLRDCQVIVYMAKGMYEEAYRVAGQVKRVYIEVEDFPGGVRITGLWKGGPLQLAGLERGDIIVSFNSESIPNTAALVAAVGRTQFGATIPVRVNRNGNPLETKVIVGLLPNLPALASAANLPPSSPASALANPNSFNVPDAAGSPANAPPSLVIRGIEVKPSPVKQDEQFTVRVSYTAEMKNQVVLNFAIHSGAAKLLESKPENFEAGSGEQWFIDKTLTAAVNPGSYTIRVRLACGGESAEAEAVLTVIKR